MHRTMLICDGVPITLFKRSRIEWRRLAIAEITRDVLRRRRLGWR